MTTTNLKPLQRYSPECYQSFPAIQFSFHRTIPEAEVDFRHHQSVGFTVNFVSSCIILQIKIEIVE